MALKLRRGLESARTNITPEAGEIIYTTDENKIYVGDGTTAGGDLVAGQKGQKGEAGTIGVDGAKGQKGEVGVAGSAGSTGAKGQKGEAGTNGTDGSDGAKGQKGEVGATGSAGNDGTKGQKGVDGVIGSDGSKGQKGEVGVTGADGSVTVSASAPSSPSDGDMWFDEDELKTFIYYDDGNSSQWVSIGSDGAKGQKGEIGVKGQKGGVGATGAAGSDGAKGQKGEAGTNGTDGSDGSDGAKGQKGEIGAAGSAGSAGSKGQKGEVGLGFNIAKTYTSVSNLNADSSPSGISSGEFAIIETGDVEDSENSRLYLWNGSAYSYVSDLSGEAGVTGAAGSDGAKGQKGEAGTNGTDGSNGSAGAKGQKGEVGTTGSAGTAGSKGQKGEVGADGSVTVSSSAPSSPSDGDMWFDEDELKTFIYYDDGNSSQWVSIGSDGAKGQKGEVGVTGSAGSDGSDGSDGAKGQKGEVGATGSAGSDGASGSDGSKGQKGELGVTGSAGAKGQKGELGVTGSAGSDGSDGDKGQKGEVGVTGDTGSAGVTGAAGPAGSAGAKGEVGLGFNIAKSYTSLSALTADTTPNSDAGSYNTLVTTHYNPTPSTTDRFGRSSAISANYYATSAYNASTPKVYVYSVSTGALLHTITSATNYNDFGIALAMDGNYLIVGAADSGVTDVPVQVYDISTFASSTITAATYTLSNPNYDGISNFYFDDFGNSSSNLSVSGNYIAIGAPGDKGASGLYAAGMVYVYLISTLGSAGSTITSANYTIQNPDFYSGSSGGYANEERDYFGQVVALDGSNLIVGTPQENSAGIEMAGAVYGFDISTFATWSSGSINVTSAKYSIGNPNADSASTAGDYYGGCVAISGSKFAVSARGEDVNTAAGVVYIHNVSDGTLTHRIEGPVGRTNFGGKGVALNGNTLFVNANNTEFIHQYDISTLTGSTTVATTSDANILTDPSGTTGNQWPGQFNFNGSLLITTAQYADETNSGSGTLSNSGVFYSSKVTTAIATGEFALIETGNVEDADNSKLYLWNGSAYSYVSDLSGEAGVTGVKGQKGESVTGSAGSAGAKGQKGEVGVTGSGGTKGQKGEVGVTGSAGSAGSDGAKGQKGEVGAAGSAGSAGSDGSDGSDGAKGQKGEVGVTGSTGSAGSAGSDGAKGQKGEGSAGTKGQKGEAASGGGGAAVNISTSAPSSPSSGDMWVDSSTLQLFVYYNDGSSAQWVELGSQGAAPAVGIPKTYAYAGELEVHTGAKRFYSPGSYTLSSADIHLGTAAAGSSVNLTINKNGSSAGTLTIAAGSTSSLSNSLSVSLSQGDYLTIDITQVGSSTAGSDLYLLITLT